MRLIDADKLYPDCMTKNGTLAISQSQIANAPTVERLTEFELIKRAILILCRNIRPDGDIRYFDWEDRCKMQDIYHELVKQEVEDAKDE